jgi:hypothetical protein
MAAGAAMMLLLGVAAAAGVYFVRPSVFGFAAEPQKKADAPGAVTASDPPAAPLNSPAANPAAAQASTAESAATEPSQVVTDHGADKPAATDPGKAAVTKPTASTKQKPDNPEGDVTELTVNDPDIPRGGVVMTERDENGQVRTFRINPAPPQGGFRPPPDGRPGPGQFPPIDMSKLTPAQRQKLLRAMRNNPQFRPPIQPIPPKPKE